jgi:hypothetical protein
LLLALLDYGFLAGTTTTELIKLITALALPCVGVVHKFFVANRRDGGTVASIGNAALCYPRNYRNNYADAKYNSKLRRIGCASTSFWCSAGCLKLDQHADTKNVAAISTCILIGLIFSGRNPAEILWVIAVCHAQYQNVIIFALALIFADANSQDAALALNCTYLRMY